MQQEPSIDKLQRVFTASNRGRITSPDADSKPASNPPSDPSANNQPNTNRNGSSPESRGVRVGRRGDLKEGAKLLNDVADSLNRDIEFEVTGPDGLVQARIKNSETGEEIRAIPPDEVILVQKKIDAFLGLFFDQQK